MIPDLDIYRSAQVLVKQHGEDPPIRAAIRADAMLEAGDLDGCAVWRRVLRAVTAAVRVFVVGYYRAAATEDGHADIGHGALRKPMTRGSGYPYNER